MAFRAAVFPLACAAALRLALVGTASAAPQNSDTQADTNHPDIHDKVGQGPGNNANANPNGKTDNGGDIHGIGNQPGKGGDNPNADGTRGQANELGGVHGGLGDVNKNVD
jgi:hypothetical protein